MFARTDRHDHKSHLLGAVNLLRTCASRRGSIPADRRPYLQPAVRVPLALAAVVAALSSGWAAAPGRDGGALLRTPQAYPYG
jgi:hypothetical protein